MNLVLINSQKLIAWFQRNRRVFPWRTEKRNPYIVWVSEMMLQQTRAQAVIPYFEKWIERFPTIIDLANAEPEEVIKLWEGLGYYSRARNLHLGAKYIVEHFNGNFPSEEHDLKKIKGLGPYTIGAIRSFAFQKKAVAQDGNTIRVLSRFYGVEEDVSKAATIQRLRKIGEDNIPENEHWIFTEALIELGATICTLKPKCLACPLSSRCQAFQKNLTEKIPLKSKKQTIHLLFRAVFVIVCKQQVLIKKNQEGVMKDLYEFPYTEMENRSGYLKQIINGEPMPLKTLPETTHCFTKFKAHLTPYIFSINDFTTNTEGQWVAIKTLPNLPFSSGHRKIANQILEEKLFENFLKLPEKATTLEEAFS